MGQMKDKIEKAAEKVDADIKGALAALAEKYAALKRKPMTLEDLQKLEKEHAAEVEALTNRPTSGDAQEPQAP